MAPVPDVGIEQKLGEMIPLDLEFFDEEGKTVQLGQYFNDKPVILTLVYYNCPRLCNLVLNGVLKSIRMIPQELGKDYDIVTISFNPKDTPELAKTKKTNYLKKYEGQQKEAGWHFLTGTPEAIQKITEAVGFQYEYIEESGEFAHGSGIMVLTKEGKVSQYLYGIDYNAKDLRLALTESSDGKVGTLVDQVLLLCFHYDPKMGKYGVSIMKTLRAGGVITIAGLFGFLLFQFRKERKAKSE